MSTALQYLASIAPTYASRADVEVFIDMARTEMSQAYFGTQYEIALAYLTAHKMALFTTASRSGGTAGAVSSKSEGSLSISFGSVGNSANSLNQTSFGAEYNRIRNTRSTAGIAVSGGNDVGY